ncbi:MAG: NADH-ubiquinone oxidoreductase-F iron-sulfur binding region domain-containing protein [Myxococcales bacterium]|nr:SLBB domain-containing protein [Myxococcota bacterium]MDW8282871.1 NADH-ubiquinone oxidoreductase-F iron-sulfur binding region domain-containing protein [Myxococcales bacterium]
MPADRNVKIVTRNFGIPNSNRIDVALQRGAYARVQTAFHMAPAAIVEEVKKSNLRGRGGAGFPTGIKWGFVPKGAQTVYLVCNADESEPGTCKDRELMYWDPHLLIEGMIISSYALGCRHAYIYIRGEMMREAAVLQEALREAYQRGYLGREVQTLSGPFRLDITLHRGAGAYICGEETSLLNSLEGKRGWPRMKPPFPAVRGLFGQPTIVNNVETLMNIPAIIEKGGQWFAELGMGRSGGTRILCMSGHLVRPGVYELPMGITLREVIYDVCGGVPGGKRVKAVIPGGTSMPPLDGDELDVPMEFDALMNDPRIKPVEVRPGEVFELAPGKPLRTMAGSGGVVVMDEDTDIVAVCARIMRFYAHESCGQCTPCREGTGWLARVCTRLAEGKGRPGDTDLCASIAHGIAGNTICPLGDAAAWPMLGFITKYRAEFLARERGAPHRAGPVANTAGLPNAPLLLSPGGA